MLKLSNGDISVLFPGDASKNLGNYLVTYRQNLKSTILKVPHHGATLLVDDTFFDTVSPNLALVPAPKVLWDSNRCKRAREYLKEKNIKTLVSGLQGTVSIIINDDGTFKIKYSK